MQASDAGAPPLTAAGSFTVAAAPVPEFISITLAGAGIGLTWKAAPAAAYDVESADSPAGPWSLLTEVTATSATASWSGTATGLRRFYRARLKL